MVTYIKFSVDCGPACTQDITLNGTLQFELFLGSAASNGSDQIHAAQFK
jgi:hypothetical protein